MPDILDASGLQVKSYSELSDELKDGFHEIYGDDLNLESNTQDGQMIGLFAQSAVDMREVFQSAWNNLYRDSARGLALDRLGSLLNVRRKAGEKARVEIMVTANRALQLTGLDGIGGDGRAVFTVSNGSMNFLLEQSMNIPAAGTYGAVFEAESSGFIVLQPGTITGIATPTAGVESVINEGDPITNGSDFEDDTSYNARISLGDPDSRNKGSAELIKAAIMAQEGVDDARVNEGNGYITAVAKGGNAIDIAQAIYRTRAAAIQLRGEQAIEVNDFVVHFDFAAPQSLYYKVSLRDRNGNSENIDFAFIRNMLAANDYGIAEMVQQFDLAEQIRRRFDNLIITNSFISTDGNTWVEYASPETSSYFLLAPDRITITQF